MTSFTSDGFVTGPVEELANRDFATTIMPQEVRIQSNASRQRFPCQV